MKTTARNLTYSVAVRRLDLARLGASLREMAAVKVAEWLVEVSDGNFVPEFALGFEVIEAVRRESALPCHVHVMAERPDRFLEDLARLGCAAVTVPIETCLHAHRTVGRIRELGMAPGLSIQPGSALTKLEYVLAMVDHVVLPVRYFGAKEGIIPGAAFDRVRILRENLDYHESSTWLHVAGDLTAAEAARLAAVGATRIVVDRKDVVHVEPVATTLQAYIDAVTRARKTV
jgi:ribulose-phosphate 3-epimerase